MEKSRKHSGFGIYFDSKDSAFAAVKRACVKTSAWEAISSAKFV